MHGCPHMKLLDEFQALSPAVGGVYRLRAETFERIRQVYSLKDHADYVRHIIANHSGEAREMGEASWTRLEFPGVGRQVLRLPWCGSTMSQRKQKRNLGCITGPRTRVWILLSPST